MSSSESPLEQAWIHYGGDEIPPHHGWVKVKCVIHDERRASAAVNLETGKWRCYAGCGHGDVYDLIGLKEDDAREFPQQKAIAAEKFGDAPEGPPEPSALNPRPRTKGPKKKWKPAWT